MQHQRQRAYRRKNQVNFDAYLAWWDPQISNAFIGGAPVAILDLITAVREYFNSATQVAYKNAYIRGTNLATFRQAGQQIFTGQFPGHAAQITGPNPAVALAGVTVTLNAVARPQFIQAVHNLRNVVRNAAALRFGVEAAAALPFVYRDFAGYCGTAIQGQAGMTENVRAFCVGLNNLAAPFRQDWGG